MGTKQVVPSQTLEFIESLIPSRRTHGQKEVYGPVKILFCQLPGIHNHLDVLMALALSPTGDCFYEPGCQAIFGVAARKVRKASSIHVGVELLELVWLVALNYVLSSGWFTNLLGPTLWLGTFATGSQLVLFILQATGIWLQGLVLKFTYRLFMNGFVLGLTCYSLVKLHMEAFDSNETIAFCTAFGGAIFTRWMMLLFTLCQFRPVGLQLLPITSTMVHIGPFLILTVVCIAATANFYYAFGIRESLFESFMITYRLVVLGEVDDDEVANVAGDSTVLDRPPGTFANMYQVLQVVVAFISFSMSVSLMNIYVAVLVAAYTEDHKAVEVLFQRHRARKVMEALATQSGWRFVRWCSCKCFLRNSDAERTVSQTMHQVFSTRRIIEETHLWVCLEGET